MRQLIAGTSPYESVLGYSRALVRGNWCFVSGTTGIDPVTGGLSDDVAQQADMAFASIATALAKGGFLLEDVVRVTYILRERADVAAVTPVLGKVFGEIRPAATMIFADLIDPAMRIEIEVTAFRG